MPLVTHFGLVFMCTFADSRTFSLIRLKSRPSAYSVSVSNEMKNIASSLEKQISTILTILFNTRECESQRQSSEGLRKEIKIDVLLYFHSCKFPEIVTIKNEKFRETFV